MDKKEILIRLLKDGHISNEEFKLLYDENKVIVHEGKLEFVPAPNFAPIPYNPYSPFDPNNPFVVTC